jgi:prophage antirepressor-like protein
MDATVKAPKNRQSRLSDDVWMVAEAVARFMGSKSTREGIETALRQFAFDLSQKDSDFAKIWNKVKEEGVTDND